MFASCLLFRGGMFLIQFVPFRLRFDGAGYSLAATKEVLSSIASDAMVDGGDCVNAVELFWTPSERGEVLTYKDALLDFPELVDL
jgi:uncharacterized membrane protein